jgi:flavorubredoxin
VNTVIFTVSGNPTKGGKHMPGKKIKNNIFYVGAADKDRRIFDQLIPLPDGTTYNSYIIIGSEKVALIDTVDASMPEVILKNLVDTNISRIDYIIAHHGEQDHSGSIPDVLKAYPMAKVVTNEKCKLELMDLLLIPEEEFIVIQDGGEISLGDKTLRFIFAPWVHWPETMVTYLPEDRILFTCDFLGAHYQADNLFLEDVKEIYKPAKRYFAEIMMPFRASIRKNLEKIKDLDIEIIAPSHGPLHESKDFIIDCYNDWASEEVKNVAVVPYISMHGSTDKIARYFINSLIEKGVIVESFNLADADIGELAMSLVDAATIVLGTPTVLIGPHPKAVFAAYLVKVLRPKVKFLSLIGSYGWGTKVIEQVAEMLGSLNAEIIEPVIVKGYPKDSDFALLDELAEKIRSKHKELGLL